MNTTGTIPKAAFLVIALSVLVLGIDSVLAEGQPDLPTISVVGDNVSYSGQLTPEGFALLRDATAGKQIRSLTIRSGGGEIGAGMDFGFWTFDNKLDVIVSEGCFSSCANYVFPAGERKTILAGAVVAWHGSALQQSFETESSLRKELERSYKREKKTLSKEQEDVDLGKLAANLQTLKVRQAEFFRKIGVDEYVTRIGQEKFGAKGFYFLSVEDMARFGIKNVVAPDDYPKRI